MYILSIYRELLFRLQSKAVVFRIHVLILQNNDLDFLTGNINQNIEWSKLLSNSHTLQIICNKVLAITRFETVLWI